MEKNIFYKKILNLLPKGIFWKGKDFLKLLYCCSFIFERIYNDIKRILDECFPLSAVDCLEDWERFLNITPLTNDKTKRRLAIALKLVSTGGNTEQYFLTLAKALDKDSNILKTNSEYFRAGLSRAGDSLGLQINEKFSVVFIFSSSINKSLIIETLDYCKPAHLLFIYKFRG